MERGGYLHSASLQARGGGTPDGRGRLRQLRCSCQPLSATITTTTSPSHRVHGRSRVHLHGSRRAPTPRYSTHQPRRSQGASVSARGATRNGDELRRRERGKSQNKQADKLCEFHLKATDGFSCLSSSTTKACLLTATNARGSFLQLSVCRRSRASSSSFLWCQPVLPIFAHYMFITAALMSFLQDSALYFGKSVISKS